MAGSIEAYQTKAGTRYRVRYRKPNGASTDKRGFTTKRDARLYLANVEVTKATGDYLDPTASRMPISELGEAWLSSKTNLKPSSRRSLETSWRVYVEPQWGQVAVGDVKASDVETWIAKLGAGHAVTSRTRARKNQVGPRSATVVLRALGVLAGILDLAVRDQRISKNPARGARNLPRKEGKRDRRYLTDAEVVRLAQHAGSPMHTTLVLVLAYCGLRWSEVAGLRVRDVNMLRRRLHVNQAAVEVDGIIEVGAPKSWEKRTVPFPKFLVKPLEHLTQGKKLDSLIFADRNGNYLRRAKTDNDSRSWLATALTEAGLERLTLHDLRHTAASLAIASGAHVKAVQRMLGHKSAAMTLDTYADLFDDDLDNVAERLDDRATKADVGKLWAKTGS